MRDLTIRFLKDTETHLAQRLLYTVYVELGGWRPVEGNPTDWRIEQDHSGHPILCDKFDATALWIGCFHGERLVGCHRINRRSAGTKFDLEDYVQMPEFLLNGETAEFTRLAVHPDYQKTHAMVSILVFEYRHLKQNGFRYFFTTAKFPLPGEMYCRMGMRPVKDFVFKFNAEEEDECCLVYFQFGDVECERGAARAVKLVDRVAAKRKRAQTEVAAIGPAPSVVPAASNAGQSTSAHVSA